MFYLRGALFRAERSGTSGALDAVLDIVPSTTASAGETLVL